jgi:hypothetical protein
MSFLEDDACIRCGKKLDHDKSNWLELNHATSLYCEPGKVPAEESQGGFEFGAACAKAILKNGGKLVRTGRAARLWGEP